MEEILARPTRTSNQGRPESLLSVVQTSGLTASSSPPLPSPGAEETVGIVNNESQEGKVRMRKMRCRIFKAPIAGKTEKGKAWGK